MPRLRSVLSLVLALSGALILSCQGDDPPTPDGGGGQGGAGPQGSTVTRTIGEDGGKIANEDAELNVPAGALRKDTAITLSTLSADQAKTLPATDGGIKQLGFPVKFTPHGLMFEQPVGVTMGYPAPDPEDMPLVAMKLDNDQDPTWEVVPGAKFESNEASFQVTSFSIYCVFEDPNGLAEMLYGPEPTGSGGDTGSGGESSGSGAAAGTGGASGGSAGSGGSTGGSGAMGGLGGAGIELPGYLDTPTFHGFGYTEPGTGATITSNLDTMPGPNCASGETGSSFAGYASLVYYVNQGTDHIELGEILVPDAGLRITADVGNERSILVELRSEYPQPASWCAYPSISGGVPAFVPWEDFDAGLCPGSAGEGAFDPTTDTINKVAVTVPSNGEIVQPFDFCLSELTTGIPNGYMNGPTWFGYGSVDDGGSDLQHDLAEELAPNCITGNTYATTHAQLGYFLDQPMGLSRYVTAYPVFVPGTGLELDLLTSDGRDLEVRLENTYDYTAYCYNLDAVVSGSVTIPWEDFSDCSEFVPFDPGMVSVDRISVRVLPDGGTDPFDLCIERLEADIPIGL